MPLMVKAMSNAEESWYFTQNGERKGPISIDLLNSLVGKGKLDPVSDLVWGPGLNDWTKAGELEALKPAYAALEAEKVAAVVQAEPDAVAAPQPVLEEEDSPPPPPEYVPVPTPVLEQQDAEPVSAAEDNEVLAAAMEERRQKRELEQGLSRGKFIGGSFALHLIGILIIAVIYGQLFMNLGMELENSLQMAEQMESAETQKSMLSAGMLANAVSLIMTLVTVLMVISRLTNLGMSRWNFLWFMVPLANIWIGYRVVACPAGYANHTTLDGAGKGLAFLYFAAMLLPFVLIGGIYFAASSGAFGDGTELQSLLENLQSLEQLNQSPLPDQH